MNKDFYTNKLKEIKELFDKKEFSNALKIIEEELSMPYIPMQYEPEFYEWRDKIASLIKGDEANVKTLSMDDILDYLKSNDPLKEAMAVENIAQHNIRPHISSIIKIIESWDDKKNHIKALLFEILSEQQINVEIKINGVTLNPANDSVFDDDLLNEITMDIEELTSQEPQLTKLAMLELQQYLLNTFPKKVQDKNLGTSIVKISKELLGQEVELDDNDLKIKKILNSEM